MMDDKRREEARRAAQALRDALPKKWRMFGLGHVPLLDAFVFACDHARTEKGLEMSTQCLEYLSTMKWEELHDVAMLAAIGHAVLVHDVLCDHDDCPISAKAIVGQHRRHAEDMGRGAEEAMDVMNLYKTVRDSYEPGEAIPGFHRNDGGGDPKGSI